MSIPSSSSSSTNHTNNHQIDQASTSTTKTTITPASLSEIIPSAIPSGHVAFHLGPTTQKKVVTTTTITTLNFPPVLLPRPITPPLLPESEAHSHRGWCGRARWPINQHPNSSFNHDLRLDPKLYPLTKAQMPPDWSAPGLPVPLRDGSFARFDPGQPARPDSSSVKGKGKEIPTTCPSPSQFDPRKPASEISSRKRVSLSHPARRSKIVPSPSLTLPPRKKVRLHTFQDDDHPMATSVPESSSIFCSDIGQSKSQSSAHPISGLPSPLPTELDQSATSDAAQNHQDPSSPSDQSFPTHPLQGTNAQPALSTISSLPNLMYDFAQLPPHLQQYTLFNLLRTSSVPVLQFVQKLVAPALKRDFINDLPPELAVLVLSKLDGQSLCRASQVSKTWNAVIDNSSAIWRHRLVAEKLWVGDGSEATDAEECRLIEQGVPRSQASHFTRLWTNGAWRSPKFSRRCRQEDGGSVTRPIGLGGFENGLTSHSQLSPSEPMHVDGPIPASPASEPRRPPSPGAHSESSSWAALNQPANHPPDLLSSPLTPPEVRASSNIRASQHGRQLSKYKLLYRKRHLTRRNWKKNEPRRINFSGHGITVVTCLQFDWDKLVAASDDNVIHSYELKTGRRLMTFTGHQGGVWALQYVANVLVTGSTDRTVRVWDMNTGRNTHVFAGHTSTVRCLQIVEPVNINPDNEGPPIWEPAFPLIVTGSRDYTLRVWKLPSEDDDEYLPGPLPGSPCADENDTSQMTSQNPFHMFFLQGHKHAVRALAAAGRTVVSGSYDSTVRVWDLITGKCQHEMKGHTSKVYSVVLDRLRNRCASGSMDNTVRLWDLTTGTTLYVMDEHTSLVGLLGFSHTKLVSAAADSTLRIWNPENGKSEHELKGHLGAITCFKHDELRVISGSDGTLKLWDSNDGSFIRDLCTGYHSVWQTGFDERFCVVAVQRGNESEYEVLDFGRTDGRTDEEDEERCKALWLDQQGEMETSQLDDDHRLVEVKATEGGVEEMLVEEDVEERWSSESGRGVESSSDESVWM